MIKPLKVHGEVNNVEGGGYNQTSDTRFHKLPINIPLETYGKIAEICSHSSPKRYIAHWIIEAINLRLHTEYSTRQLIHYELLRHARQIEIGTLPEKITTSSARTEPLHKMRKFDGFISGLQRNQFVYNFFRRDNGQ